MSNTALDEILKDEPTTEAEVEAEPKTEVEATEAERARDDKGRFAAKEKDAGPERTEAQAADKPGEEVDPAPSTGEQAAPPAAKDEAKTVPLKALEDERSKRREAAERAARLEAELAALKNPRPDDLMDPDGARRWDETQSVNYRVNLSYELMADSVPDFEDVMAEWPAIRDADPALLDAATKSKNPAKYAYDAVKRHKALAEIGTDPSAYRARIEAEIRQRLQAEAAQATEADDKAQLRDTLPTSLAGRRSATNRNSGPAFAGPTPLDAILKG